MIRPRQHTRLLLGSGFHFTVSQKVVFDSVRCYVIGGAYLLIRSRKFFGGLRILPGEALAFENKSINDAQVRERSCQMVTRRREPAAPWGVASEVDPNFSPWVICAFTGILEP